METTASWGRLQTFDWSADPRVRLTVWGNTVGVMFNFIPWYGPNQAAFQRFASLPTLAKAKWSVLLNVGGTIILYILMAFTGYALFAFYALKGCDPYSGMQIESINQLLPYYVKNELQIPLFPGIIIACILSSSFSTTSGMLNSQAAVTVIDFIQPYKNLSDNKATVLTKWLVVAYGVVGSVIAFGSTYIAGVSLIQISASLLNASTGATLGIYLLASCVPKSTWQGAFAGSLVSLLLVGWLCIGSLAAGGASTAMLPLPNSNCSAEPEFNGTSTWSSPTTDMTTPEASTALPEGLEGFYNVSFQWYGIIGGLSCLLVGLVISVPNMLDKNAEEPDEKYILPCLRGLLRRLKSPTYKKVQAVQNKQSLDDPLIEMVDAEGASSKKADELETKAL